MCGKSIEENDDKVPETFTSGSIVYPPPPNIFVDDAISLSPRVIHPSHRPCSTPTHLCPRNESNEPVRIDGLWYYRNFFSEQEHTDLLAEIYSHPWQKVIARRQQFYGEVYYHTTHKHKGLQPHATTNTTTPSNNQKEEECNKNDKNTSLELKDILPFLHSKCQPFFGECGFPSQILINEYRERLGIASHFENFEAFGPIILTISLVSPIFMTLKKPTERTNACAMYQDIQKILLEPRSLLVMQDDARYDYRHGISKYRWIRLSAFDKNEDICRDDDYQRVSVTLRHVLSTRRKVEVTQDECNEPKTEY